MMSDFLKPNIKSLAPKWMVQAVKLLALYLRGSCFESWPGYQLCSSLFIQGLIWGEELGLLRCDTLDVTSSPRWYESVEDTSVRTSECRKSCDVTSERQRPLLSFELPSWRVSSALVGKCSELIRTALLRKIINDLEPNVGWLLCKNHNVFGSVWLIVFKCMKCHVVCNTILLRSVARSVYSETSVATLPFQFGQHAFLQLTSIASHCSSLNSFSLSAGKVTKWWEAALHREMLRAHCCRK